MKKKRLLIISEFFPPQNNIASGRPYSWALFLSKKYKITVITTIKDANRCSLDYPKDCSTFKVIELGTSNFKFDIVNKLLWAFESYLKLKKIKFDIIISTSNPWQTHLIAYLLKMSNLETKWIADFRDLWSINHYEYVKGDSINRKIHTFIEKKVISKASIITTVSEPLANDLSILHKGKKAFVIYNGFENLYPPVIKKNTKITIIHTGTIYRNRRDPSILFESINDLIEEKKIEISAIEVIFYGDRLGDLDHIVKKTKISKKIVKLKPKISRNKSIEFQKNADLLLLLEWGEAKTKGILTGKLFEYMASGTPIMSIGPDSSFLASKVILENNAGFICSEEKEKIKSVILMIQDNTYRHRPDNDGISFYSREKQSEILDGIISDIFI